MAGARGSGIEEGFNAWQSSMAEGTCVPGTVHRLPVSDCLPLILIVVGRSAKLFKSLLFWGLSLTVHSILIYPLSCALKLIWMLESHAGAQNSEQRASMTLFPWHMEILSILSFPPWWLLEASSSPCSFSSQYYFQSWASLLLRDVREYCVFTLKQARDMMT